MFQRISPKNNDWNRKYSFPMTMEKGFLMDSKTDSPILPGSFWRKIEFYKCEQEFWQKFRNARRENRIRVRSIWEHSFPQVSNGLIIFVSKLFEFFKIQQLHWFTSETFRSSPIIRKIRSLTGETGKNILLNRKACHILRFFYLVGYNNRTKLILLRTSKTFFETEKNSIPAHQSFDFLSVWTYFYLNYDNQRLQFLKTTDY